MRHLPKAEEKRGLPRHSIIKRAMRRAAWILGPFMVAGLVFVSQSDKISVYVRTHFTVIVGDWKGNVIISPDGTDDPPMLSPMIDGPHDIEAM